MARTDTQTRPFKAWLKQARAYAETPFGQRFLEKSIAMSPRGSRGRYQEEMRRAGFLPEEKELFQEAWEAMLWQELFRVEYVTPLNVHLRPCSLWVGTHEKQPAWWSGEAAQRTWHQEPEQRPAGGTVGRRSGGSWQQAASAQRGRSFP